MYFGQVRVSTRLLSRQTGLPLKDSQGRQSSSPPDPWSLPQTYKDPSVHMVDTELLPMHIWELRRQPPELPPRGRRGDRESVRVEGSRWHLSVLGTAPLGQPAAGLSGTGAECPASAHSPKGSLYLTPAIFPFLPPSSQFLSSYLCQILTCPQSEEKHLSSSGLQGKGTEQCARAENGARRRSPNVCSPAPDPTHRPAPQPLVPPPPWPHPQAPPPPWPHSQAPPPRPRVPPPPWPHPAGPGALTFSRSTLPRSFSRQLIMTVAAREQFLSGSPSPSNMVSKRLMSCSGGRRFAMI